MNVSRDLLEDQLQDYETQLQSLKSYLKELNDMTTRHGTDRAHFESDLYEAEHNIKYYEDEVSRLKDEIRACGKASGSGPGNVATAMLPQTLKQGVGSLILSAVSFGVGALLGSKMKSGRSGQDSPK